MHQQHEQHERIRSRSRSRSKSRKSSSSSRSGSSLMTHWQRPALSNCCVNNVGRRLHAARTSSCRELLSQLRRHT